MPLSAWVLCKKLWKLELNMSNHYLLSKDNRFIDDLELIIDDKVTEFIGYPEKLSLQKRGNITYYFVLDAHEIGRYCFPIDIDKTGAYTKSELDIIVDSQIAYYDIFFKHHSKPIIFSEYQDELEGTYNYFRSFSSTVRDGSEKLLFTTFYDNIKNAYDLSPDDSKNKDIAVAFRLALLSFGVERLTKIHPRIQFELKQREGDLSDLLSILSEYKVNKLGIDLVCQKVKKCAKKKNIRITSDYSLERDVASLDKVYFLNKYFIVNQVNKRIIYFSSAASVTGMILKKYKEHHENLNYCEFYPWRTPIQVYFYLIFRELDEKNAIKTDKTIEVLREFQSKLKDLVEIERKIKSNYFESRQKSDEIRDMIESRRNGYIKQLDSVESSQLDNINLLYGLAGTKEEASMKGNLKKYFKENKEELGEIERFLFTVKSEKEETDIDTLLIQLKTDIKLSDIIPMEFSGNNDIITNCYDTYPFLLYLSNPKYEEILGKLLNDYWIDYYEKTQRKKTNEFDKYKILAILDDFLSLDIETTTRSQDYYTVSAMLHLVNSNENSDKIALGYIEKLEALGKASNNKNLQYIKASVLRRTMKYERAIELCNKYKQDDFRFGYCSALAVIGLVVAKKETLIDKEEKDLIRTAINDLENAFEEIEKKAFKNKSNFQAAISSDIVYLSSLYFHISAEEKQFCYPSKSSYVETAEKYLSKLKNLYPKDKWEPLFPGFYHSEAFHEYTTIRAYKENPSPDNFPIFPKNTWEERLQSAKNDIGKAIKCSVAEEKKQIYIDLKNKLAQIRL